DPLELRSRGRARYGDVVPVLQAARPSAALGRDDDRAVGRVDAVQGGRFRSLQYGQRRDVLRIQVGRPVGEVNPAIAQRGIGALLGGQHSRIPSFDVLLLAVRDAVG